MPRGSKADGGLTGGTGDVNPQVYRLFLPLISFTPHAGGSGGFTTAAQQFPVPVPKFPNSGGMAVVMEILKVRWSTGISFNPSSSAGIIIDYQCFLATKAPLGTGVGVTMYAPNDGSIVDRNQGSTAYQYVGGATDQIVTYRFDLLRHPGCVSCNNQYLQH